MAPLKLWGVPILLAVLGLVSPPACIIVGAPNGPEELDSWLRSPVGSLIAPTVVAQLMLTALAVWGYKVHLHLMVPMILSTCSEGAGKGITPLDPWPLTQCGVKDM